MVVPHGLGHNSTKIHGGASLYNLVRIQGLHPKALKSKLVSCRAY